MLELHPAEEVGEGVVQVAQGFLRRALGHLVHPGNLGLLEGVQFPVLINRRRTRAGRAVHLLLARKSPVVRPARRPRMLAAGGGLLVIQIELGLVGSLDDAHTSCARSIQCLTHAWIRAARRFALRRP